MQALVRISPGMHVQEQSINTGIIELNRAVGAAI